MLVDPLTECPNVSSLYPHYIPIVDGEKDLSSMPFFGVCVRAFSDTCRFAQVHLEDQEGADDGGW